MQLKGEENIEELHIYSFYQIQRGQLIQGRWDGFSVYHAPECKKYCGSVIRKPDCKT